MTYDSVNNQAPAEWTAYRVGQGILIEGGKVLLSGNRWYSDKPLAWTLPGGRAEEGESVSEAVVREFREETGLEVEVVELAYVAESRSVSNKRLFLACVFSVRRMGGEPALQDDAGVEDLRFVRHDELPDYMPSESLGDPLRYYLSHPTEQARYWFFPEYSSG